MTRDTSRVRVFLVDDDETIIDVMGSLLRAHGYVVETARNGLECLDRIGEVDPDVVLLDIAMPVMDGFEACRQLKESETYRRIPVLMFTGLSDREARLKALEAGASDFLTKPVDTTEIFVRLSNLVSVKRYQDFLEDHRRTLEAQVRERTVQLREALVDTVNRLTLAAEYRDEDTYVHVKRISFYVSIIASSLGISDQDIDEMFYAAPMHDIGKVGIPDSILMKPGRLTPEEFEVMKTHTTIGARILRGSNSPYLRSAEKFALTHHEAWDGTGYPQGLKGENIPIEGRIMYLIDRYDAMRMRRPYKEPMSHAETMKVILEGNERTRAEQFDPRVLAIFKERHAEFDAIYEENQEL